MIDQRSEHAEQARLLLEAFAVTEAAHEAADRARKAMHVNDAPTAARHVRVAMEMLNRAIEKLCEAIDEAHPPVRELVAAERARTADSNR